MPSKSSTKTSSVYGVAPLAQVTATINSQFGAGSIMNLGDEGSIADLEFLTTGSITLDKALGAGRLAGLPRGRIVEIYGPESCGKTTIALSAIARLQQAGGVAAFIDAEHALSPDWCRSVGIDPLQLKVSQPNSGEEGLEIADMLIRSGAVDMVVVDSVAALVPQAEIDGMMGDVHVGLQARLMSQALRKLTGGFTDKGERKKAAVCIFINQLREKVGVQWGNPETTTGGKALKFYASIRLDVRRIEKLKDESGNRLRVTVVKNKIAPPYGRAEFDLLFGQGISRESELLDFGVSFGLVSKNGAFYKMADGTAAQGREKARLWLREHPADTALLEEAVRVALAAGTPTVQAPPEELDGESLDDPHGVLLVPPPPPGASPFST
jgi:recombination protein RecA